MMLAVEDESISRAAGLDALLEKIGRFWRRRIKRRQRSLVGLTVRDRRHNTEGFDDCKF